MRFISFLLFSCALFLLSSCELLLALAEDPNPSAPAASLTLDNQWHEGLLRGNVYLKGKIRNNHTSRTIYDVAVSATIHMNGGFVRTEEITVTAIDPKAENTFEKKIYVPKEVLKVEMSVTSASFTP